MLFYNKYNHILIIKSKLIIFFALITCIYFIDYKILRQINKVNKKKYIKNI